MQFLRLLKNYLYRLLSHPNNHVVSMRFYAIFVGIATNTVSRLHKVWLKIMSMDMPLFVNYFMYSNTSHSSSYAILFNSVIGISGKQRHICTMQQNAMR